MSRTLGYAQGTKTDPSALNQRDVLRSRGIRDADIFSDTAKISASADRRGFNAMRLELTTGDTLVVKSLDNLGRSLTEILEVVRDIRSAGVHLTVLDDRLDTSRPKGRYALKMLASLLDLKIRLADERSNVELAQPEQNRRRRGRPSVLVGEIAADADRIIRSGVRITETAKRIGVGRSTLYKALRRKQNDDARLFNYHQA